MSDREYCKAKLTLVRGKQKLRATCHLEQGHERKHTGHLKDKDGLAHMTATWRYKNERWTSKEVKP